ncbi:MAG: bifunctional phosphoribosylaminoimidazolecarboxamide formyltransferase/IMP cyclohydrolase [Alphaproteobacteria bacterium]|nr:bifunctional phosphoribosylaminoimidazolecarboxamide formyltransferase/IMP cyclohydrolase [Alphaproteobacteria bacterium]MCD8570180.1 bifunctional phosphoribosylaminoimidazolecarboxamide formyltransferase/IMP cyclohydrolase [Alphaproteobacteria bacterium]
MTNTLPITRALLSVSDKTGITEFAAALSKHGIKLLSTGGTYKTLKDAGLDVQDVSSFTGFPEIMDGRVKTLHPKVHGGILARRDEPGHVDAMNEHGIEGIDMVVINLYPFVKTMQGGGSFDDCIENIDIGGPAMIRASAKNHDFVTILTNPADYDAVLADLDAHKGVTAPLRRRLARDAFALTASYDTAISTWLSGQLEDKEAFPPRISFAGVLSQSLRYGENPHQNAALYLTEGASRPGAATAKQIQGKELSYNNINDTNAAFELVAEFDTPSVAIIKHANPCGVASAGSIIDAYNQALICDPVSAFGGIIALNRPLDAATAEAITKMFVEVIIAPSVNADALPFLAKKDKIRVLETGAMPDMNEKSRTYTRVASGFLVQDSDTGRITEADLKVVTKRAPTAEEMADLLFAFRVGKHVKSNAIVYAKNRATVGIGAGQMSRLDSSRIAASKAMDAAKALGQDVSLAQGSVVASDAFFPFADGLIAAADAGVTAIIQPGGSIRDDEVIKAADERGLAMVFTGMRHFRH